MHKRDFNGYFCFVMGVFAVASSASAQDAGQIVRDVERGIQREVPQGEAATDLLPTEGVERPAAIPVGESFRVAGFQINSTLISQEELQAELRSFVGRDCTIADLRQAAARVAAAYRKRQLLAYVSIPPQTLRDGLVRLQVVEARLGKVAVDSGVNARLKHKVAEAYVLDRAKQGDTVRLDKIADAIAALRAVPGVDVRGILRAGDVPGTTDVNLRIAEGRPIGVTTLVDNHTTSELGGVRALALVTLNDFDGRGKRLAFTGQLTEHSRYAELATSIPAFYGRLWVDGAASLVGYSVGSAGADTRTSGGGGAVSLGLHGYALQRSEAPITLTTAFEYRWISNDLAGINVSSNRLQALSFGAYRTARVKQSGAVTVVDVRLRLGDLDLGRNPGNLAFDQTTARTQGKFAKLTGYMAYSKAITRDWDIRLSASGQLASKNLNGIERLAFGGPGSIAGYSTAQLDGDQGVLASVEVSRNLSSRARISAAWAGGVVVQHKRPWDGWASGPDDRNAYRFQGVSASAKLAITKTLRLNAELGVPLVKDSSLLGNGRRPVRAWVQLVNVIN